MRKFLVAISSMFVLSAASTAMAQTPVAQPVIPSTAQPTREWPASATGTPQMQPGELIDSRGEGAIPAMPLVVQQSGNVSYLNGGIGDEETAMLKTEAGKYNLHLLISAAGGAYISDIRLRVLDAGGNAVLTVADAGPYVYAQLPAGAYTLEAMSTSGAAKTLKIKIPAKGSTKAHFAFSE